MALTEEQQERITLNRERALGIRKRKEQEAETKIEKQEKEESIGKHVKETKNANAIREKEKDEGVELEEFEIDASPYVTKHDAMKMYCLPEGTMAVCTYEEKNNPRQPKWNKMKLYHRSEIRRRARERFGGLEGLIEERNKRDFKRFEKDFDGANDIFRSDGKKQKK